MTTANPFWQSDSHYFPLLFQNLSYAREQSIFKRSTWVSSFLSPLRCFSFSPGQSQSKKKAKYLCTFPRKYKIKHNTREEDALKIILSYQKKLPDRTQRTFKRTISEDRKNQISLLLLSFSHNSGRKNPRAGNLTKHQNPKTNTRKKNKRSTIFGSHITITI